VHKRDLGLVIMLTSVTVAIVLMTVADCYGLIVYRQITAAFVAGIATLSVSVGVLSLVFISAYSLRMKGMQPHLIPMRSSQCYTLMAQPIRLS
jgi:hypothetical protein